MTPEREAEIRAEHNEPRDGRCDACDLLAALDAERKAHEETRQGADLYRVDRDYHCARAIEAIRERDEARKALASAEEGADAVLRYYEDRVRLERELAAAEAALADVRQRCGGYPDSRVDGDGGIVAVVVRERDEAQGNNAACGLEVLAAERERDEALVTLTAERDEARAQLAALVEAVTALEASATLVASTAGERADVAAHEVRRILDDASTVDDDLREGMRRMERDELSAEIDTKARLLLADGRAARAEVALGRALIEREEALRENEQLSSELALARQWGGEALVGWDMEKAAREHEGALAARAMTDLAREAHERRKELVGPDRRAAEPIVIDEDDGDPA